MSYHLLFIVSLIYLSVSVDQWFRGCPAGAVVWAAYAVANWGLMGMSK